MATFASITRGPKQRKRIVLPLAGAIVNPETGQWEGDTVELDVCGLGPLEKTEVVDRARRFAIERGIANPSDGDELYDWAKTLHTLVLTCIDKDSPESDPKPFFDGGFDQLHGSKILSPETVFYLYELQQLHQDECAPGLKTMDQAQFLAATIKTAGGDMSFFVNSRPAMRWSWLRTLARLHVNSLTTSSPSSASFVPPTEIPN